MLRRAQRSLPELSRYHRVLTDAAPVLLAFVLFYGSAGMLSDDLETFRVDIPLIGIGNFFSTNSRGQNVAEQTLDPLPHPPLIWAPVLIGVLALIRWALRRVRVLRRHAALGAPAAYVEILWLLFAVTGIAQLWSDYALPWLQARRAWASTVDWLHSDFHAAGVLAAPLRAAVGLWLAAWSALNTAILVPVTAVLTAAVLYGIQTERRAAPNRPARGGGLAAFGRALVRIPRDAVMSRVGPVLSGLRVMVRVGLVAMAVFALFYAVLTVLPGFLILAERHLVGAQDLSDVWIPLNRVTVRLNAVITTVLLVALLAGVMGQVARRLDQSGSTGEQPDVVRQ
jgi:hypothetical protein